MDISLKINDLKKAFNRLEEAYKLSKQNEEFYIPLIEKVLTVLEENNV